LSRAVRSVLDQSFTADDFEVIVVNDSGAPLPEADWQNSERVRLIHTNRRERCVARNAGAAIAKGRYLHFLDDDDWLLPCALLAFWDLARGSQGALLYGGSQLVNRQDQPLIQLRHNLAGNCMAQVMAGEWIPLQASLIDAQAFFNLGGFNPLIAGVEDVELVRRIALHGEMAETPATVAAIRMGVEGSSTNYRRSAQSLRWARETILNEPSAFARMRTSAHSSAWHGRIVRIYLTSVVWNLARHRILTALSRAIYGLTACVLAGRHLLSSNFWRNLIRTYHSEAFLRGFREANRPFEQGTPYG
jgi:glycosyltransferase involved in cell wall biosynthesis